MYRKILKPLRILSLLASDGQKGEGPSNVRVLEGDKFLYGSFDDGREQILNVAAHDRVSLVSFFTESILPSAEPAE